ncbi:SDR family NAD(P)-dependent oxidoreductase [Tetragenococcus halophilus]|uniref:SDR family NAD(P)-dependent oxidoreductase n=1 Tax=Tetragenococcus halophilus TaxID=51669 RepID=UPI002560C66A|nr:SDR family NAD(P)-dependent oxidoreductase [Tetragenococcus halophilus]GMG62749.1 SDR family NAD(P)-dependent oxidoreductase [Tetragenococcus halophilus]
MYFPELKEQVVLVIGAFQGIGKSVLETFQKEKATVIACDIAFEEVKLTKTATDFYKMHLDIAEEEEVIQLTQQLEEKHLVPDVLVHVAGISTVDFLTESQTTDFDKVQAVNTRGAYLTSKYVTALMQTHNNHGRVIFVASQAGKNGYKGMSGYVASKHAVLGLCKTLALEVAPNNILVNAVCPGIVETPMKHRERVEGGEIRGMSAQEVLEEDQSQVPLGRTGTTQDVANVILFLASPLSSYMTGQAINVTGGMTMN